MNKLLLFFIEIVQEIYCPFLIFILFSEGFVVKNLYVEFDTDKLRIRKRSLRLKRCYRGWHQIQGHPTVLKVMKWLNGGFLYSPC